MKLRPRFSQRGPKAARKLLFPESLEARNLMVGGWSLVEAVPPDSGAQTMMLLTDGSVMVQTGIATSKTWAKLTPDSSGSYIKGTITPLASSSLERLYFPSTVLPSGKVYILGGEYTGPNQTLSLDNTAEIYDPVTNVWSPAATFPEQFFGDIPTSLLRNGKILVGAQSTPNTYLYDPIDDTWSLAAEKLRQDPSTEESWIALPNGNVLSYDVVMGLNQAQFYDVATNSWVDTGPVPVNLSSRLEIGAGLQLPDGRVFHIGATNQTAIYDPVSNTWQAGPQLPEGIGSDDAPAAALPNGHILFVADTPSFQPPSRLFDYDPFRNTVIDVTPPAGIGPDLTNTPAFVTRMLALPNGHVLFTNSKAEIWDYAPDGLPAENVRPTISNITRLSGDSYVLTGTKLNGYSEGAAYGDDAQMSSNYPIVQLTDSTGKVFYAKTTNWTPGLTTDNRIVSTQFDLPAGLRKGTYQLRVIANGIASAPANFSTLRGLTVLTTNPGQDATVSSRLTSFSVRFNAPINTSTLQASDLKVNGKTASRVTWDAAQNTATFSFTISPIIAQGVQSLQLALGSIKGTDSSGLSAFSQTFRYDAATLVATSITPGPNDYLTVPSATQDFVVTFSEAINPATVKAANVMVTTGTVTQAQVLPGNKSVRYSVTGLASEGQISFSLDDASIRDIFGNPAMRGLSNNFTLDYGLKAPITNFVDGTLPGADVHTGSASGTIQKIGDVDGFTVKLEVGQLLSVHIESSFATGLQLAARMLDPDGNILFDTEALFPGDEIYLAGAKATKAGDYRIEIFGINDTTGTYSLRPSINADMETEFYFTGKSNESPRDAQNLDPVFLDVGSTRVSGTKAAVVGENFDALGLQVFGTAFDTADGFAVDNQTDYADLGLWHLSERRGDEEGHSGPTSFYYGSEASGNYLTTGANAGSITSIPLNLPAHKVLTLFFSYILETEKVEGVDEAAVQVSIDGGTTFETVLTNAVPGQFPETSQWQTTQVDLTRFAGQQILLRFNFDTGDDISNEFEGWYIDDVVITYDGSWSDYYSFTAQAGQVVDVVAKATSGDKVHVDIEDIDAHPLATGATTSTNYDAGVHGYVIPATGVYYVRVYGDLRAKYEMLVTRDAQLEAEPNDMASVPDQLLPGVTMLGNVATEIRQELDFPDGAASVTVNNSIAGTGANAGLWHLSTRRGDEPGHQGTTSFYYGSETTGNYNTGARNAGSLTTGEFVVPNENPELSFNYILNTMGFATEDLAAVSVSSDNFVTESGLLFGGFFGMPQSMQWRSVSADLSLFAGKTVRFKFNFDTVTAFNNNLEGWYVDDISVGNGQRSDWYSITLGPNDSAVSIATRTTGSATSVYQSTLDPKLDLYDSTGTTLIASGIETSDARNELLNAGGLTAGATYKLRVSAEGGTRGDYLLDTLTLREPTITSLVDDAINGTRQADGSFQVPWSTSQGWRRVVSPLGYQGDYTIHWAASAPGIQNYAEWTILATSATPELFATWVALPGNATNATYEIYQGSNRLGRMVVDQTKSPNDVLIGGSTLAESLGSFAVSNWKAGTKLTVRLLTQGANGNVVADGLFDPPATPQLRLAAKAADMSSQAVDAVWLEFDAKKGKRI